MSTGSLYSAVMADRHKGTRTIQSADTECSAAADVDDDATFQAEWRRFRTVQRRRQTVFESEEKQNQRTTSRMFILGEQQPWLIFGKRSRIEYRQWIYEITGLHFTALHAACEVGDKSQVKALLPRLLSTSPSSARITSLKHQIENTDASHESSALTLPPSCSLARDSSGRIPLHHAVLNTHCSIIRYLLARPDARLQVHVRDNAYRTPVHYLLEKMERLSRRFRGASPARFTTEMRATCRRYRRLWELANEMLLYLEPVALHESERGGGESLASLDQRVRGDAWDAVRAGDLARLKFVVHLYHRNVSVFKQSLAKVPSMILHALLWTLLHEACAHGHRDLAIVNFLISDQQMDRGARDQSGRTALHYAARQGWLEACVLLLNDANDDTGMNLDELLLAQDARGHTPLHIALMGTPGLPRAPLSEQAESRHALGLYLARRCPSSLHILDHDGYSALHIAIITREHDLVRELINLGANVYAKVNDRVTHLSQDDTTYRLTPTWAPCGQVFIKQDRRDHDHVRLDGDNMLGDHRPPSGTSGMISKACERLQKVKAGLIEDPGVAIPMETLWFWLRSNRTHAEEGTPRLAAEATCIPKDDISPELDHVHDNTIDPRRLGCKRYGGICRKCTTNELHFDASRVPVNTASVADNPLPPLVLAIRCCALDHQRNPERQGDSTRLKCVEILLEGGAEVDRLAFQEALRAFHHPGIIEQLITYNRSMISVDDVIAFCEDTSARAAVVSKAPVVKQILQEIPSSNCMRVLPTLFLYRFFDLITVIDGSAESKEASVWGVIRAGITNIPRKHGVGAILIDHVQFVGEKILQIGRPSTELRSLLYQCTKAYITSAPVMHSGRSVEQQDLLFTDAIRVLLSSNPCQTNLLEDAEDSRDVSISVLTTWIPLTIRRQMWGSARVLWMHAAKLRQPRAVFELLTSCGELVLSQPACVILKDVVYTTVETCVPCVQPASNSSAGLTLVDSVNSTFSAICLAIVCEHTLSMDLIQSLLQDEAISHAEVVSVVSTRVCGQSGVERVVVHGREDIARLLLGVPCVVDDGDDMAIWRSLASCVAAGYADESVRWLEMLFSHDQLQAYKKEDVNRSLEWLVLWRVLPHDNVECLSFILNAVQVTSTIPSTSDDALMEWLENIEFVHCAARWDSRLVVQSVGARYPGWRSTLSRLATSRGKEDNVSPIELCTLLGHTGMANILRLASNDSEQAFPRPNGPPEDHAHDQDDEEYGATVDSSRTWMPPHAQCSGLLRTVLILHKSSETFLSIKSKSVTSSKAHFSVVYTGTWKSAVTLNHVPYLEALSLHQIPYAVHNEDTETAFVSLLHNAITFCAIDALRWLLASPFACQLTKPWSNKTASSLLRHASKHSSIGYATMTWQLLQFGVDPGRLSGDGADITLLHRAACFDDGTLSAKIMDHLLKADGADVNVRDSFGLTPFTYACAAGRLPNVCFLLLHPQIRLEAEYEGQSVFYYALHLMPSFLWRRVIRHLLIDKCNHAFLHCVADDCACKSFESCDPSISEDDNDCDFCGHSRSLHSRVPYPSWFRDQYESYIMPRRRDEMPSEGGYNSDDDDAEIADRRRMMESPPISEDVIENTHGRLSIRDLHELTLLRFADVIASFNLTIVSDNSHRDSQLTESTLTIEESVSNAVCVHGTCIHVAPESPRTTEEREIHAISIGPHTAINAYAPTRTVNLLCRLHDPILEALPPYLHVDVSVLHCATCACSAICADGGANNFNIATITLRACCRQGALRAVVHTWLTHLCHHHSTHAWERIVHDAQEAPVVRLARAWRLWTAATAHRLVCTQSEATVSAYPYTTHVETSRVCRLREGAPRTDIVDTTVPAHVHAEEDCTERRTSHAPRLSGLRPLALDQTLLPPLTPPPRYTPSRAVIGGPVRNSTSVSVLRLFVFHWRYAHVYQCFRQWRHCTRSAQVVAHGLEALADAWTADARRQRYEKLKARQHALEVAVVGAQHW